MYLVEGVKWFVVILSDLCCSDTANVMTSVGYNPAEGRTTNLSAKNLTQTLLGCMFRHLYKIIFNTTWYPFWIQWGYIFCA